MYSHLIREQRYAIFALKQKGKSNAEIARTIKVSPSTVSRELRRNLTPRGKYIWNKAQVMADARKHRSPGNRAIADTLRWRVEQYILQEQWSPKQISGFLRLEGVSISHETIYRMIRSDKSGELARNCRHKMKYRQKRHVPHLTSGTARAYTNAPKRRTASGSATGRWI